MNEIERALLIGARNRIRKGLDSYLCHALDKAYVPKGVPSTTEQRRNARKRLKSYILRQLGPYCNTLGWWAYDRTRRIMWPSVQDELRIAWVTWMLDEPMPEMSAEMKHYIKGTPLCPEQK